MKKKNSLCCSDSIAFLLLILGLTIAGLWTNIIGYSINILPVQDNQASQPFNRDAWLWARLFASIVVFVLARRIAKAKLVVGVIAAIILSVASGTLLIAHSQTLFNQNSLATFGVFVAGSGYILLVSYFYIHFAQKVSTATTALCIASSIVLETCLSVIISIYLPASAQALLVIAAPLLVFACYLGVTHLHKDKIVITVPQLAQGSAKYFLLAGVVVFSAQLALIRALSNVGVWGEKRTNFIGMMELSWSELAIIASLILLFTYLVFILPRNRLTLLTSCLLGFVVVLAGLQVLALVEDMSIGYIFDVTTTAAELFAHLVCWMMVISCIRQTDEPPFRIAQLSAPVYSIVSLVWAHCVSDSGFATSTFVMIINYILLLVVSLLLFSERFSKVFLRNGKSNVSEQQMIANFSVKYLLSKRETEIAFLLLQGDKRADIIESCQLSEGTVKTHIANIYRKMGIHSKTELSALYSAYQDAYRDDSETALTDADTDTVSGRNNV